MKTFSLLAFLLGVLQLGFGQTPVASGAWNKTWDYKFVVDLDSPVPFDLSSPTDNFKYKYVYSRDYYNAHPGNAGSGNTVPNPNLYSSLNLSVTGGTNITFTPTVAYTDFVSNAGPSGSGGFASSTGAVTFSIGYTVSNIQFYISRPDLVEILPASPFYASNSQYRDYQVPYTNQNFVILIKSGSGVQIDAMLGYINCTLTLDGATVVSQDVYLKAKSAANELPSPPSAPTGVSSSVVAGPNYIRTTWSDIAYNETSYEIQVSINMAAYGSLGTASANATSFIHYGTVAGSRYQYRVRAVNAGGASAWVTGNVVFR